MKDEIQNEIEEQIKTDYRNGDFANKEFKNSLKIIKRYEKRKEIQSVGSNEIQSMDNNAFIPK